MFVSCTKSLLAARSLFCYIYIYIYIYMANQVYKVFVWYTKSLFAVQSLFATQNICLLYQLDVQNPCLLYQVFFGARIYTNYVHVHMHILSEDTWPWTSRNFKLLLTDKRTKEPACCISTTFYIHTHIPYIFTYKDVTDSITFSVF